MHPTYLLTSVLPKLDSSHHLLVDEVGGHVVLRGVVPGCEDLFSKEEPPWSVALLCTLLLGVLLTLRNGIHDMVTATAQGGHLRADERQHSGRIGRTGSEKDFKASSTVSTA